MEVKEGWLDGNGCPRSLLLSPDILNVELPLVATVTNGRLSLSLSCCHFSGQVTFSHVMLCLLACFVACNA